MIFKIKILLAKIWVFMHSIPGWAVLFAIATGVLFLEPYPGESLTGPGGVAFIIWVLFVCKSFVWKPKQAIKFLEKHGM